MQGWGNSRDQVVFAGSVVASLLAHVVAVHWSTSPLDGRRDVPSRASSAAPIEVQTEVQIASAANPTGERAGNSEQQARDLRPDEELKAGGGRSIARPDTHARGRGGQAAVRAQALNLADRDDHVTLSREINSRLDRNQLQRLETSRERASNDDRRSSREPMNLIFLASGQGSLQERRPSALTNPSRGALEAPPFAHLGSSMPGDVERAQAVREMDPFSMLPTEEVGERAWLKVGLNGRQLGHETASPGVGILRGAPGRDHRRSANVATGRPLVAQAAPSVASNESGRARDNVDSEQEVAATVQSLIHASTAGGRAGEGEGGADGSGPSGYGGKRGAGSYAQPFGGGDGAFFSHNAADPFLSAYRRSVIAKIDPLWEHAFPKSASYEGRQGRAIVQMTIYADGRLGDVRLARASGVPEFDVNVQSAVRRAAPFDAFPPSIPGPSMHWSITFDMNNPAVR